MKIYILLSVLNIYLSYYIPSGDHQNITLTNFSFGSCFKGPNGWRQDMFKTIDQNDPQLWLWAGDAAYVTMQTIDNLLKATKNNECNITFKHRLSRAIQKNTNYRHMG
jgi:hypothetical protein